MIDWLASKIGILVFSAAVLGSLLLFAGVQAGVYSQWERGREAGDLARLADRLCEGCSISISFGRDATLEVREHSLTLDGAERNFTSRAEPFNLTARMVTLRKEGGIVYGG